MEARIKALETDQADLVSAVTQCSSRLGEVNKKVAARLDKIGTPARAWMYDFGSDVVFWARLHHVTDPRLVSQGKLKKLGASRDQWKAMVDDATRPTAAMIKAVDPSKSDESCWYQAQDELFAQ